LRAQANYNRITLDAGWTKVGIAVDRLNET